MKRLIAAALTLVVPGCHPSDPPAAGADKAEVALLTSLPIVFGEEFGLSAQPSPLLARLERDFTVRPVDGVEGLPPTGTLLAIQPRALPAERLVALDGWVRRGGRLVLLADPRLRWESQRPLGDMLRPPAAYPDTGLLLHWGLRLEAGDETEPVGRNLGQGKVQAVSPGHLIKAGGGCTVSQDGFRARCPLGKGEAVIIADADFAMSDDPRSANALVAEVQEIAAPHTMKPTR